jgi:shikimate 5-dehydrogenase
METRGVTTTYPAAEQPTLHFIGVSTGQSSIMRVFPAWARHLGLDAAIHGIDLPLHADPTRYRETVAFLKADPLSRGALVTTHKLDLFAAARDLLDEVDPLAALMAETSCLSKRGGRLIAHAKDPISSGLAIDGFLAPDHFARTGGEALILGAGGSAVAILWHLTQARPDRPARIAVTDIAPDRLAHIRAIHGTETGGVSIDYRLVRTAADNDRLLAALAPGSLVVNATGLGKDAPGSPLTDTAIFPKGAVAWELNYRGDLAFLAQARAQAERGLAVYDGWTYFVHGWTRVIAEVFDVAIPTSGPGFDALAAIAAAEGRG